MFLPSRASRGLTCRFAEKVAWDIEDRKPSPLFRMRLDVCLNEYLHRLLTGVHFDPERRIAEITSWRRPFFPRIIACAMTC